ncbi:MAG: four helix bundle protein [Armatimonadetes bacterium]|nr:four helix bundle protein [Armatimonadota bacterium]NOG92333.1 four helix bundle protein [Armatimonadota bacterium]
MPVAISDVIGFEPRIIWDVCAKSYQDLDVWQRAVAWAEAIYRVTREFPREEQFGLSSQLRRAAVSVACNIAEGAERASSKEKYQFVCEIPWISRRSRDAADSLSPSGLGF